MNTYRRRFIKGFAGLSSLFGYSLTSRGASTSSPRAAAGPKGKRSFVAPGFFAGRDDLPEDLFGDLCLMRKGPPQMTYSGIPTTIEPIVSESSRVMESANLGKVATSMSPLTDNTCCAPTALRRSDKSIRAM